MATGGLERRLSSPFNVHPLDVVSDAFQPLKQMSRDKLAATILVLSRNYRSGHYFLLYQIKYCKTYMTYMKYATHMDGHGWVESEINCEELSGSMITQGTCCSKATVVYVLTSDGVLFSCDFTGKYHAGLLGRTCDKVSANRFGQVPISEAVMSVSAGHLHALAMTKSTVYALGSKRHELADIPQWVYQGSGNEAPYHVACTTDFSAILLRNGNVLGCFGPNWFSRNAFTHIEALKGVQQIECTGSDLYALADGVLYTLAMGYASNRIKGSSGTYWIGVLPTVVPIEGDSKVTSFRCHETMVVAEVESKETVYWGVLNDNTEVKSPKCVPSGKHPRDMFGLTSHPATGGVVYIDLNTRRKARGIEVGWSQPKEKELKEETQWQYIEGKSPKSPNLVRNADDGALLTELRAIQSNFKHLQSDHEQLAGKYDQMTEKYKTTQKEQELLKKQYSDLLVNHKQLQDQYCTLQSQREQFNTKCSALETNIKELDIKYTKLYDEYSKASQDDIRSNQEAVGSPSLEFAAVNMVAREITADWKMLALFLGLEHCVVEEIDRYGYAKYREKAHHALRKWQKRSGENATKQVLIKALEDVHRKDIADELRDM